jgi:hypothetical protein
VRVGRCHRVRGTAVSRGEQRAEERFALDRFRDVSGELPGVVEWGPDPPDFVITDGGRRTTVEMTRYHQDSGKDGSPRARQESLEWRVLARAQTRFEAMCPGVWVHVEPYFREGVLTKRDVPELAERLARLVADELPPDPSTSPTWTETDVTWERLNAASLDVAIVYLSLWRHKWMREGEWMPSVTGIAASNAAHIEERVRVKEQDLKSYRQVGDVSWLIVYAAPLHASSFIDFEALKPPLFESEFDRVVLLDSSTRQFAAIT